MAQTETNDFSSEEKLEIAKEKLEFANILREIVTEGDSIAGMDIEIGSETKYCGWNPNTAQFVHVGWASESREA